MAAVWSGGAIKRCQLCKRPIRKEFYSGRTIDGMWAVQCPHCYKRGPCKGRTGDGDGHYFVLSDGVFVQQG